MPNHTWTRVPGLDEWTQTRGWLSFSPFKRVLKVERSACRCGAWRNVRHPMRGSSRAPVTTIVEAEQTTFRVEWQDGACCGPAPGQG